MAAKSEANSLKALGELDQYLIGEGRHERLWTVLGAHVLETGVSFAVWAPNARAVSVVGDFNGWNGDANPLHPSGNTGVWEGVVAEATEGQNYRYQVTAQSGDVALKSDPVGFGSQHPPENASVVREVFVNGQCVAPGLSLLSS